MCHSVWLKRWKRRGLLFTCCKREDGAHGEGSSGHGSWLIPGDGALCRSVVQGAVWRSGFTLCPDFVRSEKSVIKSHRTLKSTSPKQVFHYTKTVSNIFFLIIWKSLLSIFNDMLRFWMSSLSLNFSIIVVTTSQLQSKPRYFHFIDETNVTAFQVRIETRIWNKHFPGHLLSRVWSSNHKVTSCFITYHINVTSLAFTPLWTETFLNVPRRGLVIVEFFC